MRKLSRSMWAASAALSLAGLCHARDCPCRQGGAAIRAVSVQADDLPPPAPIPELNTAAPALPPIPPSPGPADVMPRPLEVAPRTVPTIQPYVPPPIISQPPLISGYQPNIGMNRWGVTPPPGTLGRTYLRRTTLVSDDEHPRKGIVVVHLPEQADVSARGLKVKWTGEEWRLETEQPLVPGVPHIYAVRAKWDTPAGTVEQVRWIRLIMGRVVDLEF